MGDGARLRVPADRPRPASAEPAALRERAGGAGPGAVEGRLEAYRSAAGASGASRPLRFVEAPRDLVDATWSPGQGGGEVRSTPGRSGRGRRAAVRPRCRRGRGSPRAGLARGGVPRRAGRRSPRSWTAEAAANPPPSGSLGGPGSIAAEGRGSPRLLEAPAPAYWASRPSTSWLSDGDAAPARRRAHRPRAGRASRDCSSGRAPRDQSQASRRPVGPSAGPSAPSSTPTPGAAGERATTWSRSARRGDVPPGWRR